MRVFSTVFSCLILVPAFSQAQSSNIDLLNFTLPDAKAIAGAHVDAAVNSPLGQFVLQQIQSGHPELQKFIADTGIDPRTDIKEVIASSDGTPGTSTHGVIAAHGVFGNAISIIEAAAGQAAVTHLTGVDLIKGPGEKAPCLALYTDGATAVAGDCVSVQAAVAGASKAPAASALVTKAMALRTSQDLWFTSVLPVGNFGGHLPTKIAPIANNPLFQAIQQTSGGVKLAGAIVLVTGETLMDSAKDATSLLNVAKFIVSIIETKGSTIPNAAPFLAILKDAQFSANGNAVDLNLTIPVTTLEQIFQQQEPVV